MKYLKYLVVILILNGVTSCECWITTNGKIIDSETNTPIENAQLKFLNIKSTDASKSKDNSDIDRIFTTDSLGEFHMVSDQINMCSDINPKIRIWKKGYKTKEYIVDDKTQRDESGKITIQLERK